ncbi:phage holin family protein [Clostridium botulinum]|uniref:Membrane protein n=1 Tax=Clostridium botulinum B str. Osaka05 TaxID=1407017 RepID=A0A0S6U1T5_CLOBO|nr:MULTISPECIES: phage holin family protein [Clostridium]EJE7234304.1 phage holin family protein [Clostridium botulinum]EKO1911245.1 phage holin family protein [Clostridium botulinum]EKO2041306.1 phage holin family protein [Clostridium botulinum]MBO0526305.1 phage holin family protein [Clostridium botulinum]MBO0527313.1 phage holin family protein [Clostridium botulinum]
MDERKRENDSNNMSSGIMGYIIRLIVAMVVLSVTAFLTPGFTISGFWAVLLAAVIISAIDYLVERFMGVDASPFGKGLKGFVISAIIIYLTQFLVPTMRVSIIGAIIAALVIGVIDAILPGRVM